MADYYVELPMQIQGAESPEEAVEAFIDQIVTFGQRSWTYLVTDAEGNTVKVGPRPFSDTEDDEESESPEEADEPEPEQPPTEPE